MLDKLVAVPSPVFRNIVSANPSIGLFDDLVDGDKRAIETAINSTLNIKGKVPANTIDRGFAYSQAVAYPFKDGRWSESRFSDGSFPVLYTSDAIMTTVYETCYHFLNELSQIKGCSTEITRQRAVYRVKAHGHLVDLVSASSEHPELTGNDYSFCQTVAKTVFRSRLPGIAAKSARLDSGVNYVFFERSLVDEAFLTKYLTYIADVDAKTALVKGLEKDIEVDLSLFF